MNKFILMMICALFIGCSSNAILDKIKPVDNFEIKPYLGKWYEIARLDHSFEKGLDNVTAEYSMREDGGIKVENQGISIKNKSIKNAIGRAYFIKSNTDGALKVSFFRPFYGSYIIFDLSSKDNKDNLYEYAFVTGGDGYLWLLARQPKVTAEVMSKFISKSKELGFNTDKLIMVKHNENR